MKYFRMVDQIGQIDGRWFLNTPNIVETGVVSVWDLVSPRLLSLSHDVSISIGVREEGHPLDVTFADFEVLILSERAAEVFREQKCQLFETRIIGGSSRNLDLFFLCVINMGIPCMDLEKSIFERWAIDDEIRPDLAGGIKWINRLVLDKDKIPQSISVFRLGESDSIIIVNEQFKKKIEKLSLTGVRFVPVSTG